MIDPREEFHPWEADLEYGRQLELEAEEEAVNDARLELYSRRADWFPELEDRYEADQDQQEFLGAEARSEATE